MELPLSIIQAANDRFPQYVGEPVEDRAYRDALESMSLALLHSGVDEHIILDAIHTAADAYTNSL